jgi:hypothetical protein
MYFKNRLILDSHIRELREVNGSFTVHYCIVLYSIKLLTTFDHYR